MKVLRATTMAIMFLAVSAAGAHGEDKPGPHGGFIRMPGAYHTEVVADGKNRLKVYLIDMDWKNPSVRDAEVSVTFAGKTESKAKCEKGADAFICTFGREVDLGSPGRLRIGSMREKQRGNDVEYATPLKMKTDKGHEHGAH